MPRTTLLIVTCQCTQPASRQQRLMVTTVFGSKTTYCNRNGSPKDNQKGIPYRNLTGGCTPIGGRKGKRRPFREEIFFESM